MILTKGTNPNPTLEIIKSNKKKITKIKTVVNYWEIHTTDNGVKDALIALGFTVL